MTKETGFKDMNGNEISIGDTIFIEEDEYEDAYTGVVLWDEKYGEYLIDIGVVDERLYLSSYAEFSVIKELMKESEGK